MLKRPVVIIVRLEYLNHQLERIDENHLDIPLRELLCQLRHHLLHRLGVGHRVRADIERRLCARRFTGQEPRIRDDYQEFLKQFVHRHHLTYIGK